MDLIKYLIDNKLTSLTISHDAMLSLGAAEEAIQAALASKHLVPMTKGERRSLGFEGRIGYLNNTIMLTQGRSRRKGK